MVDSDDPKRGELNLLRRELKYLESLGSRPTGSPAHQALVEDIAIKLTAMGLEVRRDPHRFTRWIAAQDDHHVRLTIGGIDVEVASPFPYSGVTGPAGIAGQLQLVSGCWTGWWRARDKIAVLEVPHVAFPSDLIVSHWAESSPVKVVSHPLLSAAAYGPKLDQARKAGVMAIVVVWRGLSAENAAKQYIPVNEPYHDIPALWVAGKAGERVLSAARRGEKAALVLDASLTSDSITETIWAVSPGRRANETILLVTHTDGVNAVQENGHIGLLELARTVTSRPHERTIVFVFTTGHLRIPAVTARGQATSAWLDAHPELWKGGPGQERAVGGLVLEHLGARGYLDDPVRGYVPTEAPERELLYATTQLLHDLLLREWRGAYPEAPHVSKPSALIQLGEGEPLYQRNIPCVSLVTAPQYLFAETDKDIVDIEVMRRQIDSFRRLLVYFEAMPAEAFGSVRQASVWSKLFAIARFLLTRELLRRSRDARQETA
jgi:hypothetical protein